MKSKKIQFGSGDTLGNTARLVMLGSIDACQPLRKRQRTGLASALFWLMLLTTLGVAAWLILDGFQRGIIAIPLS